MRGKQKQEDSRYVIGRDKKDKKIDRAVCWNPFAWTKEANAANRRIQGDSAIIAT